jgi:sorting nexin-8
MHLQAVNGTHLSADSNSFLEKRRRGLVRFANALVRHPVLSQEQLVVMFLTVPTVGCLCFSTRDE